MEPNPTHLCDAQALALDVGGTENGWCDPRVQADVGIAVGHDLARELRRLLEEGNVGQEAANVAINLEQERLVVLEESAPGGVRPIA